ncbi:hypothetical protein [Conexibacter sp. CPCC 206217]|uniref:hypothetical protein n=1 Tax=Conexibacter sp. CPCC 206217 TaxID=3064574 RepID=UPI00271FC705|nr:hypothetical protein [Conexibacter sp. CPCC 206217]MDO8212936.1 hypothetical protein [Conexibacter sp. CPCC 206217]
MGPWLVWLWRLLRNKRFRAWLLATAGPRAIALFLVWLERVRHRQVAIGEADQIDGMFSAAIVDGARHVIVWKDGEPVSSYPPVEGDLAAKLRAHARRDLTRPDDLPSRRARRWVGATVARARGGADRVTTHARDGAQHAVAGAQKLRQLAPGGRAHGGRTPDGRAPGGSGDR